MAFLSEYVREAYARNAGCPARLEAVVHPALATDVRKPVEAGRRKAGQIVCASAMARHKNVEAVIRALHTLRDIPGLRLVLVGGWPEPAYERDVRSLVRSLGLSEHVCFLGHVPRATLLACYAESAVFCLMSRCESFGIPAVEAQAFGTPVVGSDAGAIPEVCGRGGVYCAPDDISSIAAALRRLLVDNEEWQHRSDAARENAAGYTADRSAASFRTLLAAMLEGASRRPPGGPR